MSFGCLRLPRIFGLALLGSALLALLLPTGAEAAPLPLASGERVLVEAQFHLASHESTHYVALTHSQHLLLGRSREDGQGVVWFPLDFAPSTQRIQALAVCTGSKQLTLAALTQGGWLIRRPLLPDIDWERVARSPRGGSPSGSQRLSCPNNVLTLHDQNGAEYRLRNAAGWQAVSHAGKQPPPPEPARLAEALKGYAQHCPRPASLADSKLTLTLQIAHKQARLSLLADGKTVGSNTYSQCLLQRVDDAVAQGLANTQTALHIVLEPAAHVPREIILNASGKAVSTILINPHSGRAWRVLSARADNSELSVAVSTSKTQARLYLSAPSNSEDLVSTVTLTTDLPESPVFKIRVVKERARDAWESMADALALQQPASLD